jgi:hypothetical protein
LPGVPRRRHSSTKALHAQWLAMSSANARYILATIICTSCNPCVIQLKIFVQALRRKDAQGQTTLSTKRELLQ